VKIYTRHGDRGETDLFGGPRVPKDHLRVEVYGALDELNACLGVCSASSGQADLRDAVQRIQRVLFELGSYLATPDSARREKSGLGAPGDDDVAALEAWIDGLSAELEPLPCVVASSAAPSVSTAASPWRARRCASSTACPTCSS
jgi:cob(I)alamin adenosyltransferase